MDIEYLKYAIRMTNCKDGETFTFKEIGKAFEVSDEVFGDDWTVKKFYRTLQYLKDNKGKVE